MKLIYKTRVKPSERVRINSSADAHSVFIKDWNPGTLEQIEEFKMLLLNRANMLLGTALISLGGTDGTVTDI